MNTINYECLGTDTQMPLLSVAQQILLGVPTAKEIQSFSSGKCYFLPLGIAPIALLTLL
jgi:hypothetical protein